MSLLSCWRKERPKAVLGLAMLSISSDFLVAGVKSMRLWFRGEWRSVDRARGGDVDLAIVGSERSQEDQTRVQNKISTCATLAAQNMEMRAGLVVEKVNGRDGSDGRSLPRWLS